MKNIAQNFDETEKGTLTKLGVAEFWHKLAQNRAFNYDLEYDICKLPSVYLALPCTNAETEKVFSVVNDVKTKKRNKIGSDALNAWSLIRFSSEEYCHGFEVTDDHLKLANNDIISFFY